MKSCFVLHLSTMVNWFVVWDAEVQFHSSRCNNLDPLTDTEGFLQVANMALWNYISPRNFQHTAGCEELLVWRLPSLELKLLTFDIWIPDVSKDLQTREPYLQSLLESLQQKPKSGGTISCLPVTLRWLFKNLGVIDLETAAVHGGYVEQRFSRVPSPISPSPIHSIPQLPKRRRGAVLFPWQRFPFPDLCVLLEQPVSPRKQQEDPAHSCIFCALGSVRSRFLKRL